jgi:uncharacterized protein
MKLKFFLVVFLLFSFASALPKPLDSYVNDFGNVLNQSQEDNLRNIFYSLEQETTAQVVFVSVLNTEGEDISQYAVSLGQEWGVGKEDKDNGLVILYSLEQKKIYVASGYGLEGILPDSKIGRILDEKYVTLRDSGQVSEGIVASSYEFAKIIEENKEEVISGNAGKSPSFIDFLPIFIIFIFFVFFAVLIYSSSKRKNKGVWDFFIFFFIDFILRIIIYSLILRGGNRSSNSGGFSSGGFGGGGFGGGGAGR